MSLLSNADWENELAAMRAAEQRPVTRSAEISPCGKYRYTLWRSWAPVSGLSKHVAWIMLNPSRADADIDDPTIKRCIEFSKREGFDHMTVVNLFAYRSTDPNELWKLPRGAALGPDNSRHLIDAVTMTDKTICAWGNDGFYSVPWFLKDTGPLWCLGTNKNGSPRHPLYLRGDTPLVRWPA